MTDGVFWCLARSELWIATASAGRPEGVAAAVLLVLDAVVEVEARVEVVEVVLARVEVLEDDAFVEVEEGLEDVDDLDEVEAGLVEVEDGLEEVDAGLVEEDGLVEEVGLVEVDEVFLVEVADAFVDELLTLLEVDAGFDEVVAGLMLLFRGLTFAWK